jgi:hypothetical protein
VHKNRITSAKKTQKMHKEISEDLICKKTQKTTPITHLVQPCSKSKEGQDLLQRLERPQGQNGDQLEKKI